MAKKRKEEKPKEYTRRQLSHHKQQQRRQRIIVISGIAIIAVIILIPIIGWFVSEFLPIHQTVIEVNGVKLNMAYYIDIIKIYNMNNTDADSSTSASTALQIMIQGEIIRQGAKKIGITVRDEDIKTYLKSHNLPERPGIKGYYEVQMLVAKLQSSYFGSKIPTEDKQVNPMIMLLESNRQASEIRGRLVNGDNFTALAGEYALNYYSKNVNNGAFGWHIRDVLKSQLGSDVPLDYAFSADAGALSQPLYDTGAQKQLGYWVIKIVDRPEAGKVNVQALLLSDNVTAIDVKARLEAGTDNLSSIADSYTRYSLSKEKHGDLGVINESENSTYTKAFTDYVFNPATVKGVWSLPILEKELWTPGGSWLVKVIEKEDKRKVSDEDRESLISDALDTWYSELSSSPDLKMNDLMTDKKMQFAINRASQ